MDTYILTEQRGSTLHITLQNPKALNALNAPMFDQLKAAVELGLANSEVKGMIITGQGAKAFAAGADIQEFPQLDASAAQKMSQKGQEIFTGIEYASKPIVAAVNGYALGGGCELALACHIRIASQQALFGLPEVKLGLLPGYGGTQRLPKLVGKAKALEMMLTGENLSAEEALSLGLVSRVCPPEELLETCETLLNKMYAYSAETLAFILRATHLQAEDDGYEVERECFGKAMESQDGREGVLAFLEKRKPNFRQ